MSDFFNSLAVQARALEHRDPSALIAIFDTHGVYRYASNEHQRVLGFEQSELLGMHWTEVVIEQDLHQAYVIRVVTGLQIGQPVVLNIHLHTKSGSDLHIYGNVTEFRHPSGEILLMTHTHVIPPSGSSQP